MSSSAIAAVPAVHSIIYLGMDVHKDSITVAVRDFAAELNPPRRLRQQRMATGPSSSLPGPAQEIAANEES